MSLQLIILLKPVKAQPNKLNPNIKTNINHRRVQSITTAAVHVFILYNFYLFSLVLLTSCSASMSCRYQSFSRYSLKTLVFCCVFFFHLSQHCISALGTIISSVMGASHFDYLIFSVAFYRCVLSMSVKYSL